MDINTALIGLVAVILVLHHLRAKDCREQIRAEVQQARREEVNRSNTHLQQAYAIWSESARKGKESKR